MKYDLIGGSSKYLYIIAGIVVFCIIIFVIIIIFVVLPLNNKKDVIIKTNNIEGNTITKNNTYTILQFTQNDTITLTSPIKINYLIVAGGGAGGIGSYDRTGGGGGAGGYILGSTTLKKGTYDIVIGAGGNASNDYINGKNSSFNFLIAIGGAGGSPCNTISDIGGSGGGRNHSGSVKTTSNGTVNQGYNGGIGYDSGTDTFTAAGGGGASSSGENGTPTKGGDGGQGITISNDNLPGFNNTMEICGGGGGAIQVLNKVLLPNGKGKFGGGDGGACSNMFKNGDGICPSNNGCLCATSATTYGSGGGGGVDNYNYPGKGGNGFSGIVIITY